MEDIERTKVQWLWGNYCNYNCRYCPDHLHNNQFKPPPDIRNAMSYLARMIRMENRVPCFDFTGGEPSQLPFLLPGLREVSGNYGMNNRLVTNGSASLEWWEEAVYYFDQIEISYHPRYAKMDHIIEVYNFLMSVEDTPAVDIMVHVTNKDSEWIQGVGIYETLKAKGMPVHLKLLYSNFTRGNTHLPYKTYQWKYYMWTKGKEFELEDTAHVDDAIEPARYRHVIESTDLLQEKQVAHKAKTCYAGLEQLVVWHNGDVYRGWCKAGGKLGNVFEQNLILPTSPIECPFDKCKNGFDRQATKV